jgi:hypothetical protein
MPTIVDINQEARDLCDADTTSYPAATLLRRINQAYEQVVGWLINADGSWQFDDSNNTNLPIGTQTLVASQNAYTFNDKFLQILEVQIKDVNGNWQIIEPIDQKEFSDSTPLDEAFKTAGMPQYYDKVSDDTIKLYPAPSAANCTLASGLKIKYKRTASLFLETVPGTPDDVDKEPGFSSPYHYILSYMAAIPYCMSYKKDRVALYEKRVMDMKKELIEIYSQREKDVRKIMTFKQRSYM